MNMLLRRIAEYMSTRRHRHDIDPVDIAADLLPHLFILSLEPGIPPRFRIRLTGTALDRSLGRALRGHYMEEFLHGPRSDDVLRGFRICAETGETIWMRQIVQIADKAPRYVEGVLFPVEPDLIYGGLLFGEVGDTDARASFQMRRFASAGDALVG